MSPAQQELKPQLILELARAANCHRCLVWKAEGPSKSLEE